MFLKESLNCRKFLIKSLAVAILVSVLISSLPCSLVSAVTVNFTGITFKTEGVFGVDFNRYGNIFAVHSSVPITISTDAEVVYTIVADSADGVANITLDNVSLRTNTAAGALTVSSGTTLNLTLLNTNEVNASHHDDTAGIMLMGEDSHLVINGTGSIWAKGGRNAAGIGSGCVSGADAGNITINGGIVTANGTLYGATIGSARGRSCGDITINGGVVDVFPCIAVPDGNVILFEAFGLAAIGSGYQGSCGDIKITGGIVKVGSSMGEYFFVTGIGSLDGSNGNIEISDADVRLNLSSRSNQLGVGIGAGKDSVSGDITIDNSKIAITTSGGTTGIGAKKNGTCGRIIINDSDITITGISGAAGIGASDYGSCGNMEITDSDIKITQTGLGAGIGSSDNGVCRHISVTGGDLEIDIYTGIAIGSVLASECGNIMVVCDNLTIRDTALSGHGVGSNRQYTSCGNITVICLVSYSYIGNPANRIGAANLATCGSITLSLPGLGGFNISGGMPFIDYTYSDKTSKLIVYTGTPLKVSSTNPAVPANNSITVEGGVSANLTLSGVNIATAANEESPLKLLENASLNLTLEGVNILDATANAHGSGICVAKGASLKIDGKGELTARAGTYGAGIGNISGNASDAVIGKGAFKDIIINGGKVTARATNGAGIGSAAGGGTGKITINGGTVLAVATQGAGIGAGENANIESITINGGTIIADCTGRSGIGIGGTGSAITGKITISGGSINCEYIDSYNRPVSPNGERLYYYPVKLTDSQDFAVENLNFTHLTYQYGFKDVVVDRFGYIYIIMPQSLTNCQLSAETKGWKYMSNLSQFPANGEIILDKATSKPYLKLANNNSASVVNATTGKVSAALYDKDGKMVSLKLIDIETTTPLGAVNAPEKTFNPEISKLDGAVSAKIMYWASDFNSAKPLCGYLEIEDIN